MKKIILLLFTAVLSFNTNAQIGDVADFTHGDGTTSNAPILTRNDGATNFIRTSLDFSIEFWVKVATDDEGWLVAIQGSKSFVDSFRIDSKGTGGTLQVVAHFNNAAHTIISKTKIADNTWHHIAVVGDTGDSPGYSTDVTLYIDGVREGGTTYSRPGGATWDTSLAGAGTGGHSGGTMELFNIGNRYNAGSNGNKNNPNQFSGSLDELRTWTKALTHAEIIANMHTTLVGTETDLSTYLKFDNGALLTATTGSNFTQLSTPAAAANTGVTTNANSLNVWKGVNNTWADASNWNDGIPDASSNVKIPFFTTGGSFYPTAAGAVTVNSIELADGSTLRAQSTFAGTATYNRNLASTNWYTVASPVSGETYENMLSNHSFATGTVDSNHFGIAPYDNSQAAAADRFDYKVTASTGTIFNGQGLIVKLATAESDLSFTGTLNTENILRGITNGAGNDYNLIGNPYTTFINSATFMTTNTALLENQEIWVWNQSTNSYDNYVFGDTFKLAPAQGFFVECKDLSAGDVTFEESSQSHESTNTFQKQTSKTEIKLVLTEGENIRTARIGFRENTTKGLDNGFDGKLFNGLGQSKLAIFSHLLENNKGVDYQVQSLPNNDYESFIIPIGLYATSGKNITISADVLNFPDGINIYLEDKVKNSFTKINETAYKTNLESDLNGTGRFYLHTKSTVLSTNSISLENSINIYKTNSSTLRIVGLPQGKSDVKIYNILGKQVLKTSFTSNGFKNIAIPKLSSGVYVIHLETETGTINKKIILE